jgi:hypothetical protein
MQEIFLRFLQYLNLKKEDKKNYYRTPTLVCKNCHKFFRGYILKGTYIIDLKCPYCDCKSVVQQKEIK